MNSSPLKGCLLSNPSKGLANRQTLKCFMKISKEEAFISLTGTPFHRTRAMMGGAWAVIDAGGGGHSLWWWGTANKRLPEDRRYLGTYWKEMVLQLCESRVINSFESPLYLGSS